MMHEPVLANTTSQLLGSTAPIIHVLHRDYEARSCVLIRVVGAHRFATHPSTEMQCCTFAVDDGPVQLWTPGDPVPPEFIEAANNPDWIVAAHGDHFETAVEHHILAPQFGWPEIPIERHRCTMAMAAAVGLPARLSALADTLELANRKDAAGERLMHQMAKHAKGAQRRSPWNLLV